MAQDYSRAITASLFSGNPPQQSLISYVKTFEEQPGSTQLKARFLILAAQRDGSCKIHKAKQNPNGSFSIGKTWELHDLQRVQVGKRLIAGRPHPIEFTLVINHKTYRYDTELPSSQQAQFLVTLVRCWRKYMAGIGRAQPDLVLVGFSVDTPAGPAATPSTSTSAPSATIAGPSHLGAPSTSAPQQHQQQQHQQRQPSPLPPPIPAPPLASSASHPPPPSTGTRPVQHRPSDPVASDNSNAASVSRQAQRAPSTTTTQTQHGAGEAGGGGSGSSRPTSFSAAKDPSPFDRQQQKQQQRPPSPPRQHRPSTADSAKQSAASSAVPPPPHAAAQPRPPQPAAAAAVKSSSSTGGGEGGLSRFQQLQQASRDRRPSGVAPDDGGAAPNLDGKKQVASTSMTGSKNGNNGIGIGIDMSGGKLTTASASAPGGGGGSRASPVTPPPPAPPTTTTNGSADEVLDNETILANVEEMLEGFEWRGGDIGGGGALMGSRGGNAGGGGRKGRSKADEMERRLISELKALEAASIHAIMESDDRVVGVVKQVDNALAELDKMDLMIGLYKTQLSLMNDDIAHIESQNRGLQVQTSNQRALLDEIDKLMSTIHIPDGDMTALTQESLESQQGIERLERAAVSLYKALLSTRDTDMAAASERVGEYHTKASQFAKRVFDFLTVMFKFQIDQVVNPKNPADKAPKGTLPRHDKMEDFLGRYCGLMLFVKETDQARYQQICSAYFSAMSELHRQEIRDLMAYLRGQVRKATEEELEASFVPRESPTIRQQSMRRVGTIARAPLEVGRKEKDKDGKYHGSEVFSRAIQEIAPHLVREQGFISDFLNITSVDTSITFADYMMLETFFRRSASAHLAQQAQQGKLRDIKTAMELVFGFLEGELKSWIDDVLQKDPMQVVGILSVLDVNASRGGNDFVARTLQKQYQRLVVLLERSTKEQIRSIEHTKLTLKKRKGVVPFVRVFPLYVARVESQLDGSPGPNVRKVIDAQYDRVTAAIFDCLQQMAKMDGEGQGNEGKDQLNYHVILIENMHHIIAVFTHKQRVPALSPFVSQARERYDQNLAAYIRLVLRRPLARPLDYFAGLEQLLRTMPPTEVSLHSAYTRSALRRVTGELRAKDLRKAIDALYKRVDKHFGGEVSNQAADHTDVLKTVWKACEEEMVRLVTAWKGLIAKCYPDEKSGNIEVGKQDLHTLFSNAQNYS
ncbi:hypothetical protein JCM8115_005195 [Rhodotorula mucilaginosa]